LQLLAIHCSFFTTISGISVARPVRFAGDAELVPLDREVRCSNLQMKNCYDVGDHSEHGEHGDHGNALIMVMVRCDDTHTDMHTCIYIYVYYSGDDDDGGTGTFEEVNLEPGLFAVACFVGIRVSPHRCYQLHLRYRRLSAPLQSMLVELIYSIMKAGAQWVVSSRPHDASKLCDHQTSCQPQPILGSLFGCWGM
jgi:hypothetical protein